MPASPKVARASWWHMSRGDVRIQQKEQASSRVRPKALGAGSQTFSRKAAAFNFPHTAPPTRTCVKYIGHRIQGPRGCVVQLSAASSARGGTDSQSVSLCYGNSWPGKALDQGAGERRLRTQTAVCPAGIQRTEGLVWGKT